MAKKKKRSSAPNIPQEALDRARAELNAAEADDEVEAPAKAEAPAQAPASAALAAPRPNAVPLNPRPVRVRASSTPRRERDREREMMSYGPGYEADPVLRREREIARKKKEREQRGELPVEIIRERLANPTRVVTPAEMAQEYSYVIRDLRSIAILAVALVIVLVALSFVL